MIDHRTVELVPGENILPGLYEQPYVTSRGAEGGETEFEISLSMQVNLSAPTGAGRLGDAISVAFRLDKISAIVLRERLDEAISQAGL